MSDEGGEPDSILDVPIPLDVPTFVFSSREDAEALKTATLDEMWHLFYRHLEVLMKRAERQGDAAVKALEAKWRAELFEIWRRGE